MSSVRTFSKEKKVYDINKRKTLQYIENMICSQKKHMIYETNFYF